MPLLKDPNKKGNLKIRFNIEFPSSLTPEQKKIAAKCFQSIRRRGLMGSDMNLEVQCFLMI